MVVIKPQIQNEKFERIWENENEKTKEAHYNRDANNNGVDICRVKKDVGVICSK